MAESENLLKSWQENDSNRTQSNTTKSFPSTIPPAGTGEYSYSKTSFRMEGNSGVPHIWYIALLVIVKLCSSFSIFLLANLLNSKLSHTLPWVSNSRHTTYGAFRTFGPFIQIITFIQLGSGIVFMMLLNIVKLNTLPRPVIKKGACTKDSYWFRVLVHSLVELVILSIRLGGLQLCGPFRTVFVGTYYDLTLMGIVSTFTFNSSTKWQWQGVGLFVIGIVLEYLFDDSHLDHLMEPWHQYTNWLGISLLLISAFAKFGLNTLGFTQNLWQSSGGQIQLHTASTLVSGILVGMLWLIETLSGDFIFFHMLPVAFIVIFGFVIDYYVDIILQTRMEPNILTRIGTTASYFSAFMFVLVLSRIGTASTPGLTSLTAFGLIYLATICLTTGRSITDASRICLPSPSLPRFMGHTSGPISPTIPAQLDLSFTPSKHTSILVA